MKQPAPHRSTRRRAARGQSLVEYSMLNWILISMLVLGMAVPIFPGRKNVIELFMDAYQIYFDSFYFVLNMPFP